MDANAFPTPVEAAELGLNPAPAPLHTGLSDLPDLEEMTGETPQKLADAYHHQLHEHHHEQQVFCTPAAAPSFSAHSSSDHQATTRDIIPAAEKPTAAATTTSGKTPAAPKPPTVREAYKDGVAQGETLVGAVLETAYGIAQTGVGVIQKITDKVTHLGEGGER
ncbi:hypothetical protein HDU87_000849 [Geranomyces variabilis]|uniref:Uncharacterized protein n=1 Tax=Geranomyces variabilis TaxID=109894 RepID=A0AAD5XIH9_9FUNG|nr:hypothetical protein HDU87_000849 [Geranomyces variabilis]